MKKRVFILFFVIVAFLMFLSLPLKNISGQASNNPSLNKEINSSFYYEGQLASLWKFVFDNGVVSLKISDLDENKNQIFNNANLIKSSDSTENCEYYSFSFRRAARTLNYELHLEGEEPIQTEEGVFCRYSINPITRDLNKILSLGGRALDPNNICPSNQQKQLESGTTECPEIQNCEVSISAGVTENYGFGITRDLNGDIYVIESNLGQPINNEETTAKAQDFINNCLQGGKAGTRASPLDRPVDETSICIETDVDCSKFTFQAQCEVYSQEVYYDSKNHLFYPCKWEESQVVPVQKTNSMFKCSSPEASHPPTSRGSCQNKPSLEMHEETICPVISSTPSNTNDQLIYVPRTTRQANVVKDIKNSITGNQVDITKSGNKCFDKGASSIKASCQKINCDINLTTNTCEGTCYEGQKCLWSTSLEKCICSKESCKIYNNEARACSPGLCSKPYDVCGLNPDNLAGNSCLCIDDGLCHIQDDKSCGGRCSTGQVCLTDSGTGSCSCQTPPEPEVCHLNSLNDCEGTCPRTGGKCIWNGKNNKCECSYSPCGRSLMAANTCGGDCPGFFGNGGGGCLDYVNVFAEPVSGIKPAVCQCSCAPIGFEKCGGVCNLGHKDFWGRFIPEGTCQPKRDVAGKFAGCICA